MVALARSGHGCASTQAKRINARNTRLANAACNNVRLTYQWRQRLRCTPEPHHTTRTGAREHVFKKCRLGVPMLCGLIACCRASRAILLRMPQSGSMPPVLPPRPVFTCDNTVYVPHGVVAGPQDGHDAHLPQYAAPRVRCTALAWGRRGAPACAWERYGLSILSSVSGYGRVCTHRRGTGRPRGRKGQGAEGSALAQRVKRALCLFCSQMKQTCLNQCPFVPLSNRPLPVLMRLIRAIFIPSTSRCSAWGWGWVVGPAASAPCGTTLKVPASGFPEITDKPSYSREDRRTPLLPVFALAPHRAQFAAGIHLSAPIPSR